jgi:hypothetical protein
MQPNSIEWQKPTLTRSLSFAFGMALPAPKPSFLSASPTVADGWIALIDRRRKSKAICSKPQSRAGRTPRMPPLIRLHSRPHAAPKPAGAAEGDEPDVPVTA